MTNERDNNRHLTTLNNNFFNGFPCFKSTHFAPLARCKFSLENSSHR